MTKLSAENVRLWFKSEYPDLPCEFLNSMESVETWTRDNDGGQLLINLEKLVELLDLPVDSLSCAGEKNLLVPGEEVSNLILLLAYCKSGVSLRLMEVMSRHQAGLGDEIFIQARNELESSDPASANVVLARIKQIVLTDLMRKLFGIETRKTVLATVRAIEGGAR